MKQAYFNKTFSKEGFDQFQENGLKEGIYKLIREQETGAIDSVQVNLTPKNDGEVFMEVRYDYEPIIKPVGFGLANVYYKFEDPKPSPEPEEEEDKPMYLSDAVQSVIHDCDLPLKLAFIQKLAPEVYWRYSGRLSDYIDEMYMDALNEEWIDWDAEED